MKKRMAIAATVTAVVALGAGAGAASAADYIYWGANAQSSSIGRANVDGSGANQDFIPASAGVAAPFSVMLGGGSLYWINGFSTTTLATANQDGSGVNTSLASFGTGFNQSQAALAGPYVYFPAHTGGRIGRVGTNGTGLNDAWSQPVFPGAPILKRVVSDGSNLYSAGPNSDSIGKVGLDGTVVDSAFVSGITPAMSQMAVGGGYIYWTAGTGIGRVKADGSGLQSNFISGLTSATWGIAVGGDYIYWGWGQSSVFGIGRVKTDGTDKNANFITGLTKAPHGLAVTGGGSAPTPTPTPTPAPTPTPTATTLATPTVNTSAPGSNAVVTVRAQLGPKGRYTFIFEKPSANEMSREQATSSRVGMQKGTRLGKRILKKTYTAAVITTTADGAKVVTRALVRKAQAKKLNLRVVYAPTGTAQTESVIKIK